MQIRGGTHGSILFRGKSSGFGFLQYFDIHKIQDFLNFWLDFKDFPGCIEFSSKIILILL